MSKISQCLSDSCSARTRKRCVFDAVPKFPGVPDALSRGGYREAGNGKIRSKFAHLNNEKGVAEETGSSRHGFSPQSDRPPVLN